MLLTRHLSSLEPVLDSLLRSGSSRVCCQLFVHLEDRFLTLLLRCLHALLHPFNQRKLKLPPGDTAAVRRALFPHKRFLLRLAEPGQPEQKRAQLTRSLKRGGDISRVLAGFLRTLHDLIVSFKKERGSRVKSAPPNVE